MEYYVIDFDNSLIAEGKVTLSGHLYHHLAVVLRKKANDVIDLTDGYGNIYTCRINEIDKKSLYCELIKTEKNLYEPDIKVRLFISPLRNQSRFEFAVEKTVEIGVAEIIPVITKYTVSKSIFSDIKIKRLKNIIKSGAGQSQRCIVPDLKDTVTFSEMIELTNDSEYKIVMYEHSDAEQNKHLKIENKRVDLLVGPEGGFDSDEISLLRQNGWIVRSLGKRKFRAETAAIVSLFEIIKYL